VRRSRSGWPEKVRRRRTWIDATTDVHSWHLGVDGALPVVLVHGIGAAGEVVAPLAVELEARFAVSVPDLPGFGRSGSGRHAPDSASLASALARWCELAGLGRAAFVGVSAGCQVLLHLAVDRPELVERLVLQGPTVDRSTRNTASQLLRLGLDAVLERPSLWFVQLRGVRRLGMRRLRGTAAALIEDRPEQLLPRTRCPVLVVRGGWDPLAPARWTSRVAQLAPQGRHATIPRAPHALVYSRPRQLARVLVPFLAEGEAQPPSGASPSPSCPKPVRDSRVVEP
jgi:2-hydroxy-6-oxonona-2,4-dienedioate hydrolase